MRWNTIILVALALFSVSCTRKPERSLVGEWQGKDSTGQTATFVFNSDQTCKFVIGNVVLDGSTSGGKTQWRADMSRDPMTIEIVETTASGQQSVNTMIFRFITDHKIQVRLGKDIQSRPTGFSEYDAKDQLVLIKQ
jgi:hypothetical protein